MKTADDPTRHRFAKGPEGRADSDQHGSQGAGNGLWFFARPVLTFNPPEIWRFSAYN